jgi:UDP-2,3-diacylglucosamine hydrolase
MWLNSLIETKKDQFVLLFLNKMIGLFLGSTDFPKIILNKIKSKKEKYFIIDLTKNNNFKKDKNSHFISIGKFGQILKLIHKKKCKKVIFAGKIDKPKFSNLKLDIKGVYYIPRVIRAAKLGDAAILKELIKILDENKIKVIKSNFYSPELTLIKGIYSKIKPDKYDLINIKIGIKSLNKLNAYNHVQALVVRNNSVLAKETSSGTKKMLLSINKAKKKQGILIKFPKKKQDLRADIPTVGLDTIKDCKNANIKGIVLKANQNIFLDKKKCIDFVNKNKMFIKTI